jgi:hypothetical protein
VSKSRLITAAKVVLYINGKPYALVTSFAWTSQTPKKAIYGLDSGEPYELAPGQTKCQGQIGLLRAVGEGGLEGIGVTPFFHDLPREKYFTLALVERGTDTQIFRADRCSIMSQAWNIPAKGMVTGTMTFEAMDWNNEAASK